MRRPKTTPNRYLSANRASFPQETQLYCNRVSATVFSKSRHEGPAAVNSQRATRRRCRMSLAELREQVAAANRGLAAAGLVTLSFGNVSGIDRARGVLVIKPSGIPCAEVEAGQTVVVSLRDGSVVEGSMRPSSDTPTHLALYGRLEQVGGIVHTHSPFASAWAQAGRAIPCLGTTHADHFAGPIPVTRPLTEQEISWRLRAGDRRGHRPDGRGTEHPAAAHARRAGHLARPVHLG